MFTQDCCCEPQDSSLKPLSLLSYKRGAGAQESEDIAEDQWLLRSALYGCHAARIDLCVFGAPGQGQSPSGSQHRLFATHPIRSSGGPPYTAHKEEAWLVPGLLGDQVRMTESPELTPYLEPLAEGQARAAFLTQEVWGYIQG